MRSVLFVVCIVISYLLFKGGIGGEHAYLRFALAVLVASLGLFFWDGKKSISGSHFTGARRKNVLDVAVAGALIIVGEFLTMSVLNVSSDIAIESSERFVREWDGDPIDEGESEGDSGEWLLGNELERSIPKSSDHKPLGTTEVLVEALNEAGKEAFEKERVYLRGFTFEVYEGDGWKSQRRFRKLWKGDGAVRLRPERKSTDFPLLEYRVFLNKSRSGNDVAFALQGVLEIGESELRQVADGVFLLPETNSANYTYDALSQQLEYKSVAARAGGLEVGGSEVDSVYLELPEGGKQLSRYAELLSEAPDSVEGQLDFIKQLLNERCEYSLKVENSASLGSMENFLFGEKRGYCEHFASAAVLFCRQLGIPSRVAYGYAGGTYYDYADTLVFRARDGHAWAEVYLDDYGWAVFETTPSSAISTDQAAAGAVLPKLTGHAKEQTDRAKKKVSHAWWWVMAGGILGGGVLLLNGIKQQAILRGSGEMGGAQAPPKYLTLFQEACVQKGLHSVQTKTVRELVVMLASRGEEAPFLQSLEAYHNGVTYRCEKPDLKKEKELLRLVKAWSQKG